MSVIVLALVETRRMRTASVNSYEMGLSSDYHPQFRDGAGDNKRMAHGNLRTTSEAVLP